MTSAFDNKNKKWFVLRDLKRANAKQPAYKLFKEKNGVFYSDEVEIVHSERKTNT